MNITQRLLSKALTLAFILPITNSLIASDSGGMELGGRLNIVGSDGTPTNDMLGYGLIGHYHLSNNWYLGLTLDISPEFDFEHTAAVVGVIQDPAVKVIDAVGTSSALTGFIERRYPGASGNFLWFWNVGAGFANVDFDNVTGPVQGGGTFDISTSAETEILLTGSVGLQQRIDENWSARYTFSLDQHFADWTVTDSVSGNTAKIDDYAIYGIRLGMNYRF